MKDKEIVRPKKEGNKRILATSSDTNATHYFNCKWFARIAAGWNAHKMGINGLTIREDEKPGWYLPQRAEHRKAQNRGN